MRNACTHFFGAKSALFCGRGFIAHALKGEILEHENLEGFSVQEISQDFFEQKLAHSSAGAKDPKRKFFVKKN